MENYFVRNISARKLLDSLFVSAIVTILVIRAFLFITGYPYIGGVTLHIAHMLWGGLFMLTAIILLVAFLGRRIQVACAILGGVGFGFFIDELGKFLTMKNDYFFQPTFMLIYLIFIGLYFIIRELDRHTRMSEEERLVNALELSKDAVMHHFDEKERKQMVALISGSFDAPMFGHIRQLIDQTVVIPSKKTWWARKKAEQIYNEFIESKFLSPLIVAMLIFQGGLIMMSFWGFGEYRELRFLEQSIIMIGMSSAIVSALFVVAGLAELRKNREEAFQRFYRANLISVLLTQPFAFYVATFIPILALAINLSAMVTLQILIVQEKKMKRHNKHIK